MIISEIKGKICAPKHLNNGWLKFGLACSQKNKDGTFDTFFVDCMIDTNRIFFDGAWEKQRCVVTGTGRWNRYKNAQGEEKTSLTIFANTLEVPNKDLIQEPQPKRNFTPMDDVNLEDDVPF